MGLLCFSPASRRRLALPGEDRRGRGGAEDGGQRAGGFYFAGGPAGQIGASVVQPETSEDAGDRVSSHAALCLYVSKNERPASSMLLLFF